LIIQSACGAAYETSTPAEYRKQLMALGLVPGDPDSAANAFVDLKIELDKEKVACITAQIKIDVLTQTVKDLKISADRFAA
jgi:hypothetical protein